MPDQPTDLRTLAAEALVRRWNQCDASGTAPYEVDEDALADVDAVLAAVLPAHRATVLTEAAEAIEAKAADLDRIRNVAEAQAFLRAAGVVRRLAGTGPEVAPISTLPAQQDEVVPVEAPEAHSGSQGPWTCTCHPGVTWTWTPWPTHTNAHAILGHTSNAILAQADGTVYAYYAGQGALRKEHTGVTQVST